jgi:gamma-glutamylcyclotransferase (GGCT)/AIG2-like uncharacterized protein YtfP
MAQPTDHDDPAACGAPKVKGEQRLRQQPQDPVTQGAFGMAPGALPQERQLVFVYGTLKRGEKNHHWLEGASWQGEAELNGVVLHDLGPFPMAVIGEGKAIGEVYAVEVSGLARLDELEAYPRLYDRQALSLSDGRQVWVYLGRPRQVCHAPLVVGGSWHPTKT